MVEPRPTAVIVGATGGIGRAIADLLAQSYELVLVARDGPALEQLATRYPGASRWVFDLREGDMNLNSGEIPQRVDVLILAAGVWASGLISDTPDLVWRDVFAANLFGQIALTRILLPALRAARGRVIVVNSTAVTGSPMARAVYVASKAALRVFGTALHEEELASGVRVTNVYPGRVATPMQSAVRDSEHLPYEADRYMAPSTFADAVLSLLSTPNVDITELVIRNWPEA